MATTVPPAGTPTRQTAPVPTSPSARGPAVSLDARLIGFAGVGRMIAGLWQGLVEEGAEVTGLWPAGAPRDWMGAHRAPPAGRHVAVQARPFLPAEQLRLPALLRRLGVAVHHAPYFAVPYAARVPVVLTVHDLFPYLNAANARSRATAAVYRTVVPLAIRRASRVVAVSPFTARQLTETFGLSGDRLRVIEHGVDHARWRPPAPALVAAVRARHRLPGDYLLYVGTLKRHKNLATVLAAHTGAHPPLVLAGAGSAELSAAGLDGAPGVLALGRVPDGELAALYAGARALVLPSLYEAVGFTALEAMACGTPVVCSDGGGLPDTVGDAGMVVPALHIEAWREALTRISGDEALRARMAAAGRALVAQRSWRAAAARYLEVYRELAA